MEKQRGQIAAIILLVLSIGMLLFYALPALSKYERLANQEVVVPMKIHFRQSGGYAGLVRGYDLDTERLSAPEAAEVRDLVQQSGILDAKGDRSERAADVSVYDLTIETPQKTQRVVFDDLTLPEAAIPLIDYLQDRSESRPPQ